jgi:hypothetical protein
MRLSEDEFRRERIYTSTMVQVKKLLKLHLIDTEEYWRINTRMKEKYHPVSDGLISETGLL